MQIVNRQFVTVFNLLIRFDEDHISDSEIRCIWYTTMIEEGRCEEKCSSTNVIIEDAVRKDFTPLRSAERVFSYNLSDFQWTDENFFVINIVTTKIECRFIGVRSA